MSNVNQNNRVTLTGQIVTGFEFAYELHGEKFYRAYIEVNRLSKNVDVIPVQVSEKIVDVSRDYTGVTVRVDGEYRSYNQIEGNKRHLILFVFATEFREIAVDECINRVHLDGFICKVPKFRTTPLGKDITDFPLAVNRPDGKTDYIPCIAWWQNAAMVATLEVGTHISIFGRVQSRPYTKNLNGKETETRIAYEVSIGKVKVID